MTQAHQAFRVIVPLRTVSEANAHEHWRKRQKRAKQQRQLACIYVANEWNSRVQNDGNAPYIPMRLPARITLTRLAPRTLDSDNLQGAMKHVRDGVADAFGVDDRDSRYDWQYDQRKAKEYGVEIVIEHKEQTQ